MKYFLCLVILFALIFSLSAQGQDPIFITDPIITVYQGKEYFYPIKAANPEGGAISYSATLPSWLSFSTAEDVVTTTVAGSVISGFSNGSGANATFNEPNGISSDAGGNIYVADKLNNMIRKVSLDGDVSTLVGSGIPGYFDGQGARALLNQPIDVVADNSGSAYFIEIKNFTVRKIDQNGQVSTLAGDISSGDIDGIGTAARFGSLTALDVDLNGNVYVLDKGNNKIKRIAPNGEVETIINLANDGIVDAREIVVDDEMKIFVIYQGGTKILVIDTDGSLSVFAGSGDSETVDGNGTSASFANLKDIDIDSDGNLYVAQSLMGTNHIRKITPQGDVSTIVTGSGFHIEGIALKPNGDIVTSTNTSSGYKLSLTSADLTTSLLAGGQNTTYIDAGWKESTFNYPHSLTMDNDGNIYVTEFFNNTIRKLSTDGSVTTIAGDSESGYVDGSVNEARFSTPQGLLITDDGIMYVADLYNHVIRKISEGVVSTFAGNGDAGYDDGLGTEATFKTPKNMHFDNEGNILLTDGVKIRKITPAGNVTTVAGNGTWSYSDGEALQAGFGQLGDIDIDSDGNILVMDNGNFRLRKISTDGLVSTIAGSGTNAIVDGVGTLASFSSLYSLNVTESGEIYMTDYNTLRVLETDGSVRTIAGEPNVGAKDGIGLNASFSRSIRGMHLDGNGDLILADFENHLIRKVSLNTAVLQGNPENNLGSYPVSITAADQLGNQSTQSFNIEVIDGVDPVITSATTVAFEESGTGTVYTITATDASPLTYSLGTENDEALFNIDANTGEVTFKVSPDFEVPVDSNTDNVYVIEVKASDGNNTSSQAVSITITDADDDVFEFKSTPVVFVNEHEEYLYSVLTSKPDESSFSLAQGPDWLKISLLGKVTSTTGVGSAFTKDVIGNIYTIVGNQIKRVDANTGEVTLLAGSEDFGSLDGVGVNASFDRPRDIEFGPDGLLYVADMRNSLIRRVTLEGEVSTFAGIRIEDIPSPGPYSRPEVINGDRLEAIFFWPTDIEFGTNGIMYIADSRNYLIRKIDTNGQVSNFAGKYNIKTQNINGLTARNLDPGYLDGPGSVALFNTPSSMSIDAENNIYVTDQYNHKIRKVSAQGVVTTIAGGIEGYLDGDLGNALFSAPEGIIVDTKNRIFIGEGTRIRMIDANGSVSTIAGGGASGLVDGVGNQAQLRNVRSMRQGDADQLKIAHGSDSKFRTIDIIHVLSGNPFEHVGDHEISLIATDGNSESISQNFTLQVRDQIAPLISEIVRINPIEETVKTNWVAFRVKFSEKVLNIDLTDFEISLNSADNVATSITKDIFDETLYTVKINVTKPGLIDLNLKSSQDITDTHGNELVNLMPTDLEETFLVEANNDPTIDSTPVLEVDDDQVYTYELEINDIDFNYLTTENSVLPSWLKIETEYSVETLAGSVNGFQNGLGTSAKFNEILGLASDRFGNTYVAEKSSNNIRKVTPEGEVTSFASISRRIFTYNGGTTSAMNPSHVTIAADGTFYISTSRFGTIERMTSRGERFTLAGSEPGYADGEGANAKFSNPLGTAVDKDGNIIVADADNNVIRKISPSGLVTTLAGSTRGFKNGNANVAQFKFPSDIAIDDNGNIFVVDAGNNRIRKIDMSGNVSTFAGSSQGYADGLGTNAKFNYPLYIEIDQSNNLYVADRFNYKIRKIDPSGNVSTVAGSTSGLKNGRPEESKFMDLGGIAIDPAGNLIVVDYGNSLIRKISNNYTLSGSAIGQSGSQPVDIVVNDNYGGIASQNFQINIIDVTPPLLTSAATATFTENGTGTAYTITATDASTLTYSLGTGNDEALFNVDASTGEVTFKTAPDFETPADGNSDNAYEVNVISSDGINSVNQNVTITVTDVFEDPNALNLLSSSPLDGAVGFNGTVITLTFNRPVTKGSGPIEILNAEDDSRLYQKGVKHPDISINGAVVSIDLNGILPNEKEVYLNIAATAFKDMNDVFYAGISDKTTLNFFTPTKPALVSSTPSDGSNEFAGTTISLTFDRNMERGAGVISILDASDNSELWSVGANHPDVHIFGSTITLDLRRPLPLDKEVYLDIEPRAFRDMNDQFFAGISDNSTLNFFTRSTPKLISSSPADNAMGFRGTTITLTFDRDVFKGNGEISIFDLSNDNELWSRGVNHPYISIDGAIVTVDIKRPLPLNKQVYVNISPTAFRDVAGSLFYGIDDKTTLNFTADRVISSSPSPFNISESDINTDQITIGIYPNPASHEVTLDLNEVGEKPTVTITNLSGMEIFRKSKVKTHQLIVDVSSYSQGVFLITVTTETGEVIRKKMSVIK